MKKSWIAILIVLGVALIGGIIFLVWQNKALEDKYEHLEDYYEDRYDEDLDNTPNVNPNNTPNVNPNNTNNYISKDEALQIALNDLKLNKNEVYDIDVELEYKAKYNKQIYEISFDYKQYEYEYFIDAQNGDILNSYKSWD